MAPKAPVGFRTRELSHAFRHPSTTGLDVPSLDEVAAPHIESFNALFEDGGNLGLLQKAIEYISPRVVFDGKGPEGQTSPGLGNRLEFKIISASLSRPMIPQKQQLYEGATDNRYYPSEAREGLSTYQGKLTIKLSFKVNDELDEIITKECGSVPIMVRSNRCNLRNMTAAQLVAHHEEAEEFGGYFIINGIERIVRLLILQRRHYVVALIRNSFKTRGALYSPYAVTIRCVRPDETSVTISLHYLTDGGVMFRFGWRKREYFIPVVFVLKALASPSDKEIFEGVMMVDYQNTFLMDRMELLLRNFKTFGLRTGEECLGYLGAKFRIVLGMPEDLTNSEVGAALLKKVVLVHLTDPRDKYRLLLFMLRKLFAVVSSECCVDNPDSAQHQEVLLPGFLYGMILKECMEEALNVARNQFALEVRKQASGIDFFDKRLRGRILQKAPFDIGSKMLHFLSTGNLSSPTGLDLQQLSGFTVVAEKLNWYRYLSHFQAVHRGAFFTDTRTVSIRKLLPEGWGFICPVHTPDGEPCGLLNHFSRSCRLITESLSVSHIPALLFSFGMTQPFSPVIDGRPSKNLCVHLDGKVVGWAPPALCNKLADTLRIFKTEGKHQIPLDLEIAWVPVSKGGQYPGLYLFSGRARMMRPLKCLLNGRDDSIGTFEQVYMNIAVRPEEIESVSTHVEHSPDAFLSVIAALTPFSDFNQSPRNIYQCQMGKQSMGTPMTAFQHRTDHKLYRLQSGQSPVVRPELHNAYGMDHFPNGTNAVVAVISYTGYDMEDAMILNKSAHERGFGYGTIYKSQVIDLQEIKGGRKRVTKPTLHFGIGPDITENHPARTIVDADGFPMVGARIRPRQTIATYIDDTTRSTVLVKYKGDEDAIVDQVRVIAGETEAQKIQVTLRIPRSPVIGDKFSSRHGQKGVCSQKWPSVDMPFSESGIQPDVIINPHAFPSRMTIGMFVESMAGKAGAVHGLAQDATPFKFNEEQRAVDYFGEQLITAGYNYYGNEPMYSGITGQEFAADIYLGVVFYQRLRHMVNDKWQVRTTGPVDPLTRQPVQGRKRGGGIRFGEMERDALIAHGTSYLLQDRLMNCSDYSVAWVCRTCGSLISLGHEDVSLGEQISSRNDQMWSTNPQPGVYCRVCRKSAEETDARARSEFGGEDPTSFNNKAKVKVALPRQNLLSNPLSGGEMDVVAVPYVFRYLCAELASMGIGISLEVS